MIIGDGKYRLVITRQASEDIENFILHIAQTTQDKNIARNILKLIRKTLELLVNFPELGHKGRKEGTLEFTVPKLNLILFYKLDKSAGVLYLLAVLHARINVNSFKI